jgi:SPFH domain / Band 7 family
MFGIQYKKSPPTVYTMHFVNGALKKGGAGLSFLYFAPTSTIVQIPVNSVDVPFIFQEVTKDFQALAIQGQLTYRVVEPEKLAQLIDFSINAKGAYSSVKDPRDLVATRLINRAQALTKVFAQQLTLHEALGAADNIATGLSARLRGDDAVLMLGLDVLSLSVQSIKPTPETAKALEAEAREALLLRADQAIYLRRNSAVEEERRIKESELQTEIAVETKQREIRETKMRADIALEEQRSALIDKTVENERKDADSKAYALRVTLQPLETANWKTLMAVGTRNGDPRLAMSLAFEELAANAGKIGQLNITPDLLGALLTGK